MSKSRKELILGIRPAACRSPGRPKLPKKDVRSFRLPLRIKQHEADYLIEKSLESGLPFTEFLRVRLLFDYMRA